MELFDLLQELCQTHGPSGDEGPIRERIAALARPFADEVTTDVLGNLIVRKKGTGPRVMLAAHMDSIGFIVTHIEKEGFLRVGRLGGVSPQKAIFTPVRFKNGVEGVFVPEEKADLSKLKWDDCCIDIGARDEAEARSLVQVGDTAVYASPTVRRGCSVISPYTDDRVSCAVLLAALERIERTRNDLYCVFTVQEEVSGQRGGKTAAWSVDPDYGIALDVTYTDDLPGRKRSGTCKLGMGPGIKVMDSSVICHPEAVRILEELAQGLDLPVQRDILTAGGTDGGPIHTTRAGVRTGGISIPCRYMHSPQEMIDLRDMEACVQLTAAFAQAELNPTDRFDR